MSPYSLRFGKVTAGCSEKSSEEADTCHCTLSHAGLVRVARICMARPSSPGRRLGECHAWRGGHRCVAAAWVHSCSRPLPRPAPAHLARPCSAPAICSTIQPLALCSQHTQHLASLRQAKFGLSPLLLDVCKSLQKLVCWRSQQMHEGQVTVRLHALIGLHAGALFPLFIARQASKVRPDVPAEHCVEGPLP